MITIGQAGWAVGAAMLVAASGAMAADLQVPVVDAPAVATTQSPWQVRVRALGVITNEGGSVDGIAGSDLDYSNSVTPELDITYYFTNNIAAELILGTTSSHVYTGGSIEGLGEVGKTWILPPTLTLQYHFTDFGAFKPYIGAGVNYTIFYNQSDAGDFDDMDIENSFGAALQIGFDYMLDRHWGVNFDVKKIFLEPDWTANLNGTELSGEADVSPWLIGGGVTYRF
jgi:outer membrane protein